MCVFLGDSLCLYICLNLCVCVPFCVCVSLSLSLSFCMHESDRYDKWQRGFMHVDIQLRMIR